ncbi:MAG TPA: UDP-N-acetylmuramate dehydrogenase [Mycobacteriales bacterium]|nr:UDP-N-acetylmuramate dehydrogenase [Mycobacteriales bacterium]
MSAARPTELLPPTWDPTLDVEAVDGVASALSSAGLAVAREDPLGARTTLGVGGAARCAVVPRDADELTVVLTVLASYDECAVPLLVVGRGSNLLVGDLGWPGVALRLGAGFKWQQRAGAQVSAGGGLAMPALAAWTAAEGLSGLEFAAGIPASVGGSVRMNAGAHHGSTADRLVGVRVASVTEPAGAELAPAELSFGYRRSLLPPRSVVTAARWELAPLDPAQIRGRLDELRAWRRATQPLRQRNCGSVFTNPDGDSAGRLVEAAGCKGRRRGGARISEKHANSIVVDEPATAADVRALIAEVRAEVVRAGGPLLEPEVRLVGRFDATAETP